MQLFGYSSVNYGKSRAGSWIFQILDDFICAMIKSWIICPWWGCYITDSIFLTPIRRISITGRMTILPLPMNTMF